MEFSYTIDDRIAGVSADLIQVDKKRAEEINKLRVSATEQHKQNESQFFNFEKDFVLEGGDDNMNAKEPRWRKDDTMKKSALENLEKLSQVLEEENRLLEEKVVEGLINETRPTGDLILLTATEGHVHLAPIAYIFLILYILYITIGMGRTYLNK